MKRVLFLAIVLAFTAMACKKSGIDPAVYGKWELREQSGGWVQSTIFQPGNGHIYQFFRNNTYKKFDGDTLSASGKFLVKQDNSYGPQTTLIILFDNDIYGDPIHTSGDKLTIGSSVADGLQSDYQKIGN